MTTLGIQIGWLAVRVTVFMLCAAAMAWWSARRAARSAVIVIAAAMAIVLALSAGALFPAPDFGDWSPLTTATDVRDADAPTEIAANDEPHAGGFALSTIWKTLGKLSRPAPQPTSWPNGSAFVAIVYGLGMAVAGCRLISAWLAVQTLRRRSRPIVDANVLGLVDLLRNRLACSRPVELRACDEPGLAATVGSWRPVIFLPPEWRQWTESETQAVLAHELAHVQHGDYLSGFLTRVCQALHFYHPLVYWLSNQMRWQQELAADDLAASILVERGEYVKSLASLALRSPARTLATMPWSAINGGALLRRIEMLRETRNSRPLNWRWRGLLVGTLAGIGLVLASLGGAATPPEPAESKIEPFEIGYVPANAQGINAIRPAVLFEQPGMDKTKAAIAVGIQSFRQSGCTFPDALNPENIEQIVASYNYVYVKDHPDSIGAITVYIRLKQDFDWLAFFTNFAKEYAALAKSKFEVNEAHEDGVTFYLFGFPDFTPLTGVFTVLDRRSVVFRPLWPPFDPPADIQSFTQLVRNVGQARQRNWGGFDKVARAPFAMVLSNHDQRLSKALNEVHASLGKLDFAAMGIAVGDGERVRLILDAKSEAAATEVEKDVSDFFETVGREVERAKSDDKADKGSKMMATLAGELYQSRKLNRQGVRLEWTGFSSVRISDFFGLYAEALIPAGPAKVKE